MGLSKWLSNHDEYDIMENPFYFCFLLSCYTLQTLISHHWTLRIGKLWPVTTTFQNQRIANNKEAWKQSSNTTRTFNFGGRDILNSPMILISVSFIKWMNEWMQINRKNLQFWWSGQSEFLCDFDKNILLKEWMKEWTNWFVREKINGQMILNRGKIFLTYIFVTNNQSDFLSRLYLVISLLFHNPSLTEKVSLIPI